MLFPILSSCSRRGTYEEILESKKEAESLAAIPETNGNITGGDAPDYETPIMLKTGNTPFYEGKTLEDLISIYKKSDSGKQQFDMNVIPTGRVYDGNDTHIPYFYNKLTGNFSKWCSDPLCDGNDCIWLMASNDILYVSDKYIYFLAEVGMDKYGVYRCDFQRNNIEKIKDVAIYRADGRTYRDEVDVLYEKDDVLYIRWIHYVNTNSIQTLYTLDMNTKEEKTISGDVDLQFVWIAGDQIFYSTTKDWYTLYKTNLSFENPELFWEHACVTQFNDQYMILREMEREPGATTVQYYSYNLKTGEWYTLKGIHGNVRLCGEYLYHTCNMTDEEIENDPLKDYYSYKWYEEANGNGSMVRVYDGNVKSAGRIYRTYIGADYAEEECVFQLTYKGVPVRINDFEVDGEVIYFNFNTYETCKNFYNQEFEGDETRTVCHGLADLQNGTVTFLELPKEEEE